jgi:hypothetical protein
MKRMFEDVIRPKILRFKKPVYHNYFDRNASCNLVYNRSIKDFKIQVTRTSGKKECVRLTSAVGMKVLFERLEASKRMLSPPTMQQADGFCGYHTVFYNIMSPAILPYLRERIVFILKSEKKGSTQFNTALIYACLLLSRFQLMRTREDYKNMFRILIFNLLTEVKDAGYDIKKYDRYEKYLGKAFMQGTIEVTLPPYVRDALLEHSLKILYLRGDVRLTRESEPIPEGYTPLTTYSLWIGINPKDGSHAYAVDVGKQLYIDNARDRMYTRKTYPYSEGYSMIDSVHTKMLWGLCFPLGMILYKISNTLKQTNATFGTLCSLFRTYSFRCWSDMGIAV